MRAALYACDTRSRDRDRELIPQLLYLRDFAGVRGWDVHDEYVDCARVNDLGSRTEWRRLLDDGAQLGFSLVVVFRLGRAFRSVKHMHETLAVWDLQRIALVVPPRAGDADSAEQSAVTIGSLACLGESVMAGGANRLFAPSTDDRAERPRIGRPLVTSRPRWAERWAEVRSDLNGGCLSHAEAARRLGCGHATLLRLLKAEAETAGS